MSEDPEAPEVPRPFLRVVRGEPTPEELAALIAVLSVRGGAAPAPEPVRSAWGRPGSGVRGALPTHPGAWRESGFAQGVRTRADW
ncbi:MAG TPA: acyl-CoA carboxylase subunit epsilon [Frankiaceae bacterium]|nr:acyl-CoA carboxylase subunit epsilon [Frankiaceae bacterium]